MAKEINEKAQLSWDLGSRIAGSCTGWVSFGCLGGARGVVKEIMGFKEPPLKFGTEKGRRFIPGESGSPV